MNPRLADPLPEPSAPGHRLQSGLQPAPIIGLAAIARLAFSGGDLKPLRQTLINRITADAGDTGALLDLSVIELILGRRDNRLSFQAKALAAQRLYRFSLS